MGAGERGVYADGGINEIYNFRKETHHDFNSGYYRRRWEDRFAAYR